MGSSEHPQSHHQSERALGGRVNPIPGGIPLAGSRRIALPLPGGRCEFSVPAGVTREQVIAEHLRFQEAIERGKTRRIVSLDGDGSGLGYWLAVARSYVDSWARQAWLATFGRGRVRRRMAEHRALVEDQAA